MGDVWPTNLISWYETGFSQFQAITQPWVNSGKHEKKSWVFDNTNRIKIISSPLTVHTPFRTGVGIGWKIILGAYMAMGGIWYIGGAVPVINDHIPIWPITVFGSYISYIPTNPNNPGCYNHSFLVASTSNPITFPTFAEQLSLQVFSSTSTSETILHRGARYSTSCQICQVPGAEDWDGLSPWNCLKMWENDDETIILLPFWWGKWWLANFVHQWILGYFWTDLSRKPHTPKRWSAGLLVQMVGRICHEVDHGHLAKRQGRTWKLFWEVRTRQNTREYWERTNQKMYLSLSYSWECHMLAMYGAISKIERTPNNWHVLNAAILKYASLNIESSENISPCCRNMLPCSIYRYHIPTSSSLNSQQYMAMFKKKLSITH